MTTTLSSKGQVVLPAAARRRLGTRFACRVQGNQIVLIPAGVGHGPSCFVKSKLTGLVVTQGPRGAPVVTSEQVRALLADFP